MALATPDWRLRRTVIIKEGTTATVSIAEKAIDDVFDFGYKSDSDVVAFVGMTSANPTFYQSTAYDTANYYARFGMWSTNPRNNRTTWTGITKSLCGINLNFCTDDKYTELIDSDVVANMPVFPEEGYIGEVDGVIVVKISGLYH